MSFLTSATDVAIEKDLKQFLIILIALSAAIVPKIFYIPTPSPLHCLVIVGLV